MMSFLLPNSGAFRSFKTYFRLSYLNLPNDDYDDDDDDNNYNDDDDNGNDNDDESVVDMIVKPR